MSESTNQQTMPDVSVTCVGSGRPVFELRLLFTAILLAAMWSSLAGITSWGSKIVLAVIALTYLFGCWKTRRAVVLVFPAMYLPYVWLFAEWPWHGYQRHWIEMLWQLPGLVAEVAVHPTTNTAFAIITSLATLLLFFAFIFPARLSLKAAWLTAAIVLLASLLNSMFCYYLFRA